MADIKQLPDKVAEQISAGEVIERPASVVKELVENSIDAGSDRILIAIKNGGKNMIRVKDNGSGIKGDQLELAFSRYATSKIQDINDIYSLHSLGFRGEALASIASVSQVEVRTRVPGKIKGNFMKLKGGDVLENKTTGCPEGTDIIIRDLFFNTPARYKYLKTVNTEFGHISDIVYREALAYPEIQFTLKHNNRQVLKTPGNGKLKDSIYAIYGTELNENLIPVDFSDRYISVKGYITDPNYNRSSRRYEMFFVNKRSVKNNILNRGVEAAYKGLLPPRKYPIVFLFIELNPILIDVNVHPTKREVKFSRNNIIKDVIEKGIRKKIKTIDPSVKLQLKKQNNKRKMQTSNKDKGKKKSKLKRDKLIKSDNNNGKIINKHTQKSKEHNNERSNKQKHKDNTNVNRNNNNYIKESETHEYNNTPIRKILGQIHNTYIIVEGNDGLYIVDQHTAHERILYDKFKDKFNTDKIISQPLLIPVNIEVTISEKEIINKYSRELENLGIIIEEFGTKSIALKEVPSILKKRGNKKVFREIIDEIIDCGKTIEKSELIEQIILFMACRGAVKAGNKLETREMEKIINDLFKSSNPYRCPHQRPVILHLSEKDIEKGLGRK